MVDRIVFRFFFYIAYATFLSRNKEKIENEIKPYKTNSSIKCQRETEIKPDPKTQAITFFFRLRLKL